MAETVDNSRYRAISLLRLSTDEQAAEGRAGLLRQKEEIRIATTRWGLEICKRYEIIDVSGTVIQQSPIFQEVIAQLQNPSVHGIVVSDLSRLMRPDDFSSFGIYDFFAKNRKLIFTPSSVFDLTDDAGFLQAGIESIIAGVDRKRILRRMFMAKEENRKRGRCANAKITLPQGLDFDFKTGKWHWVEPYASRIRTAFQLVLGEQQSVRQIANQLGYKSPRTLYNQLRNPVWTGVREYRFRRGNEKYSTKDGRQGDRRKVLREIPLRVRISVEPIISENDFAKVQEILLRITSGWKSARSAVSKFESSGLLFCTCGHRMYSKAGGARPGRRDTYYCSSQHTGGKGCGAPKISREQLDHTVTSLISEFFANPSALRTLLESAKKSSQAGLQVEKVETAKSEIQRLHEEKKRLLGLAVKGLFESSQVEEEARRIDSELHAWEIMARSVEREVASILISDMTSTVQKLASVFTEFEFLQVPERKTLLRQFFSRIYVRERAIEKVALRIPDPRANSCIPMDTGSWPRPT